MTDQKTALKDLQRIPSVGKAIARDLWNLGFSSVTALKGQDPEVLYVLHNRLRGEVQDICMFYTFRCAVYFAENVVHDPQKLKWWHWMDPEKMNSIAKDAEIRKNKGL